MIDDVQQISCSVNGKTIMESSHRIKVGKTINFYDDKNEIIQLEKKGEILNVTIKINNIRTCLAQSNEKDTDKNS